MMPRWLSTWMRRREHRRELEDRLRQAEEAARQAQQQWPTVRRAADVFTGDMRRAMGPRQHPNRPRP